MLNPEKPWKKNLFGFYLGSAIIIGVLVFVAEILLKIFQVPDPPNLSTLVVEIGIGVIITVTVFAYSKRQKFETDRLLTQTQVQQNKIAKLVEEIKKIEENQQKIIKANKNREENWKFEWGKMIIEHLEGIKNFHEVFRDWLIEFNKNRIEQQKENIIISAKRLGGICDYHIQHIREDLPKISEFFDDPKLSSQLIHQSEQFSGLFYHVDADYVWKKDGINDLIQSIEHMIELLSKGIQRVKNEIPKIK